MGQRIKPEIENIYFPIISPLSAPVFSSVLQDPEIFHCLSETASGAQRRPGVEDEDDASCCVESKVMKKFTF
jgi:hypothetical protein